VGEDEDEEDDDDEEMGEDDDVEMGNDEEEDSDDEEGTGDTSTCDSGSETEGEEESWAALPVHGSFWESQQVHDPDFWDDVISSSQVAGGLQTERAQSILVTHDLIPVTSTHATVTLIWPKSSDKGYMPKYIFLDTKSGLIPKKNRARFLGELGDTVQFGAVLWDRISSVNNSMRQKKRSVITESGLAAFANKAKEKLLSSATAQ
jgi:hypothetical protein